MREIIDFSNKYTIASIDLIFFTIFEKLNYNYFTRYKNFI